MPPKPSRMIAKAPSKVKGKQNCEFCQQDFSAQGLHNHQVKCGKLAAQLEEAQTTIASLKTEMKELREQLKKSQEQLEVAKVATDQKAKILKTAEEKLTSLSHTVGKIEESMKERKSESAEESKRIWERITQLESHGHRLHLAGRPQVPVFQPPAGPRPPAWGPQGQGHVPVRIPLAPARKSFPQKPETEVTIAGIPFNTEESRQNLVQAVLTIAKAKAVMMSEEDIDSVFRAIRKKGSEGKDEVREQKDPPRVVVRFRSNKLKNEFKRKKKDDPALTVGLIAEAIATGGADENTPLYINENLTPEQRSLFWKARNLRKRSRQGCFSHCWTKDGRVSMRDFRNRVWEIRDEQDLESEQLLGAVAEFGKQ